MEEARMWKRVSLILLAVLAICAVVVIGIVTMVLRNNVARTEPGAEQSFVESCVEESEATAVSEADVSQTVQQEETSGINEAEAGEENISGQPQVLYGAEAGVDEMLAIESKYCTLLYPAQWSEYLFVQETEVDAVDVVTFFCSVGEADVVLYNVYFNGPAMGDIIGYIIIDGEKVSCSVEYSDYIPEDWGEEEKELFFAMAECINDVIDSVKAHDSFSEE